MKAKTPPEGGDQATGSGQQNHNPVVDHERRRRRQELERLKRPVEQLTFFRPRMLCRVHGSNTSDPCECDRWSA